MTNCDCCAYYVCDEETDEWYCSVSLDEDEMYRYMEGQFRDCPYFSLQDEYAVVRKQN